MELFKSKEMKIYPVRTSGASYKIANGIRVCVRQHNSGTVKSWPKYIF
jgi:hypothetical protein